MDSVMSVYKPHGGHSCGHDHSNGHVGHDHGNGGHDHGNSHAHDHGYSHEKKHDHGHEGHNHGPGGCNGHENNYSSSKVPSSRESLSAPIV